MLRLTPGRHKPLRALNLGLADQSAVDLTDNAMAVAGLGAAAAGNYVKAGYDAGKWDGAGVRSSAAAADPARYGLGYAVARDVLDFSSGTSRTFSDMAVSPTDALFRTTVLGDANLDGVVNFDDLLRLAKHYNTSGTAATWSGGDFTYDGSVNFDDLLVLAKHYNAAVPIAQLPAATAGLQEDVAAAFAQVPEPSGVLAWGIACIAAMTAKPRRRRANPSRTANVGFPDEGLRPGADV